MKPYNAKFSRLLDEAVYNIERGRWWWKPLKSAIERWIFSD